MRAWYDHTLIEQLAPVHQYLPSPDVAGAHRTHGSTCLASGFMAFSVKSCKAQKQKKSSERKAKLRKKSKAQKERR